MTGNQPWYSEGLKFRCTACGVCCTGEPGHVWVTHDEVARLARAKGQSVAKFSRTYVRSVGKRLSLNERPNGDCVMLKDGKCTVYADKPKRCTTFPFWSDVIDSRVEWNDTAKSCEGMGQGDLYSAAEIQTMIDGDESPMREKHAREPEETVYSRHPATGFPPFPTLEAPQRPTSSDLPMPIPSSHPEVDWKGALLALTALYDELEAEIPHWEFTCSASGRCCDFDAYGHRLYASTLEVMYFYRSKLFDEQQAPVQNDNPRMCPAWGSDRLCHARDGRMLGCRTYFCAPYPKGIPEELHGGYHDRIRDLHARFKVPYAYADVLAWADTMRTGA